MSNPAGQALLHETATFDLRDGWHEAGAREDAAGPVRDRIADAPLSMRMPASGIELSVVRDFIDADQCAALIALIDAGRIPSPVVADNPVPSHRTSETCYLAATNAVVAAVEARLEALTGIDPVYGETLQGQRYGPGQQFKPHHDFFQTDQHYWREQVGMGGQRTWTAMVFLNAPAAGGQTDFPASGVQIVPRRGNLLIWNNMDEYGAPNAATLHAGMPVLAGVKYVLTKWYRERPWCR